MITLPVGMVEVMWVKSETTKKRLRPVALKMVLLVVKPSILKQSMEKQASKLAMLNIHIYIYIQNNKHLRWYVSCTCFLTIDFGRFACWFSYGNYLHVCAMYPCCVCWTSTTTCWQGLVCWTYLHIAIYKHIKSILDVLVCFLAFVKLHKLHVLSCWSFLTLRGYLNLRMCNQVEIM